MRSTGRYDEILAHFQASLRDLSACDCEPQTKAAVLLTMAATADTSGNAETVLEYANQADEIYRRNHFDSLRPQSMRLIAAAFARKRDWTRAIAQYEAAIRLADQRQAVYAMPDLHLELAAAYGDSVQPQKGMETLARTAALNKACRALKSPRQPGSPNFRLRATCNTPCNSCVNLFNPAHWRKENRMQN